VKESARIIDRALDLVEKFDIAAAVAMFAEQGVLEVPNRADGPRSVGGRQAVEAFMGLLPQMLESMTLVDRRFYETTDPLIVIAEYRSEATTRTGRPYRNRYIGVFELDTDGKIALWREYFDPRAIDEALGTQE
jgi:ketosteroid isomerase-like protein